MGERYGITRENESANCCGLCKFWRGYASHESISGRCKKYNELRQYHEICELFKDYKEY